MTLFEERFPWWGGDLQTLRSQIRPSTSVTGGREVRVMLTDGTGDEMVVLLHEPPHVDGPLVVLVHGLTGSMDSAYMVEGTRFHLARGHRVARVNLRGAGPSSASCSRYYHAGCVAEMLDVLRVLRTYSPHGMVWVGHSLGASILVNMLAELPIDHGVLAAVTVSAPVNPMRAARTLQRRRNQAYQASLLRKMKADVAAVCSLQPDHLAAVQAVSTIEAFDDVFTAPLNGYGTAANYYERTSAGRQVGEVSVPLLMIHADNDPWIPADDYTHLDVPKHVQVEVTRGGGHVGFHGCSSRVPWHIRRAGAFFRQLV